MIRHDDLGDTVNQSVQAVCLRTLNVYMQTIKLSKVLPIFSIGYLPSATALAASVYSTMLYPGDDCDLDRFACAQAVGLDWRARTEAGDIEQALPVVQRELVAVLDFYRRTSCKKLMTRRDDALSAGQILKFMLLLQKTANLDASVNKAVALIVKLEAVGERTLENRWAAYKSVSPLWAAYNEYCIGFKGVSADWRVAAWHSFMTDPKPFLAIAQHFRDLTIRHGPKGTVSARTLESNETWSIPTHIGPLPSSAFFNPQLLYVGLTQEAKSLLERYRKK